MEEKYKTTLNPLYEFPEYYDIIFCRDISSEIAFLADVFELHRGRPLGSYLDLGCGPGYHARGMAKRGVTAMGIDFSTKMIDFARHEADREHLQIDWCVGDMRNFDITTPIDMAGCLFDAIDGLLSIDDFVQHFQAVARNLKPDGLYVIGQMHQRDTPIIGYGPFHYRASRGGKDVALDWATDVRTETRTQTADVNLELRVTENNTTEVMHHRTRESFSTLPFLEATTRLSGSLEPFAWYGDFDLTRAYDDSPASCHCISIYRKTSPCENEDGNS